MIILSPIPIINKNKVKIIIWKMSLLSKNSKHLKTLQHLMFLKVNKILMKDRKISKILTQCITLNDLLLLC